MDKGAWWTTVHGVAKSRTRLSSQNKQTNKNKYLRIQLPKVLRASLVAQMVKNLHAMQETWILEDPLEKGMAPHSSILAWSVPWTEEPGGLQSKWLQKS